MLRATLFVSLFTLIACGADVPRPRISLVETTCQNDVGSSTHRYELYYTGSQLTEVRDYANANLTELDLQMSSSHTYQITYTADRLTEISVTEDHATGEISFTYDSSGEVQSMVGRSCEDGDCGTVERTYSWNEGQLLTQDQITNGNLESWQFGWSGDQLQQITTTWGEGFEVDRFSYTANGELQRMTRDDGFISFRHNEGRLSGASDSDGNRWEIAYNLDGLIGDITQTRSWGGQCVTRYTYLTGEITGVVPVPPLPGGKMFDMAGQTQKRYEILTTKLFM